MKRITIDDINFELEYEGYLWYSNASEPELRTKISKEDFTDLPFIIEGAFWAEQERVSLNIKNIDGEYHLFQVTLKNLPEDQTTQKEFLAHKLGDKKKIKILQFWEEKEDAYLEGMTTLKPSWQAFQGFSKS